MFFTTRSAHLLLETLSLEGLGSVESHLKKIMKTSPSSIPSSITSPLAHLSVTMDTSSYGTIQILQTCKVLRSPGLVGGTPTDSNYKYRSSVLCLYTSGFQGNALLHHNSIEVNNCDDTMPTSLQMTLKLAAKFCLPVLQAGLFAINISSKGEEGTTPGGITPNYSFLDFAVEPSSVFANNNNKTITITNIGELSMNKLLLTTAAKFIQSEFSSSPILMWSDVYAGNNTPSQNPVESTDEGESELSNNSLVINMSFPSVRLQLGGPKHGIPSANQLCIDSSWIYGLVEIWKPLIEDLVMVIKKAWRNKITRDRQLLMSLITAAMDISYRKKVLYNNVHVTCMAEPLIKDTSLQGTLFLSHFDTLLC